MDDLKDIQNCIKELRELTINDLDSKKLISLHIVLNKLEYLIEQIDFIADFTDSFVDY